ncbi:sigma-70 family RNA polymerase sigma factor [Nocardia beijingensis]|uniref:RNA polymerase sigma factor n=1 Tax=Nocardia beijingensis TaxID=95162 RepID=UPI00344E24D4
MTSSPEQQSLEVLVRRYFEQLLVVAKRYALYRQLPADTAADILSTALERIWIKEWFTLQHEPRDRQLATIYRYMQNIAQEQQRTSRRVSPVAPEQMPEDIHYDRDITDKMMAAARLDDVVAALAVLTDREREVLELAAIAGLSNAEIAEQTDSTTSAVSTMLSRARARLKAGLRVHGHPEIWGDVERSSPLREPPDEDQAGKEEGA